MKRIKVYEKDNCRAEVWRNAEWEEYVVKFYVYALTDFVSVPTADYHTDSKDDAVGTAKAYCGIK